MPRLVPPEARLFFHSSTRRDSQQRLTINAVAAGGFAEGPNFYGYPPFILACKLKTVCDLKQRRKERKRKKELELCENSLTYF